MAYRDGLPVVTRVCASTPGP